MQYFLIIILLAVVAFILSPFFKKKKSVLLVIALLFLAIILLLDQMKYTTFSDLYASQLKEDTVVESIDISINEISSDGFPNRKAKVTIKDEALIGQVLSDFIGLELKKEDDIGASFREYSIRMVVTNQIKENHFRTRFLAFDVDANYLNDYRIISESNPLKTIESLKEDEKIDWETFE